MSMNTDDHGHAKTQLPDGSALFTAPYDPQATSKAVQNDISQKTDSNPHSTTPDPTGDGETTSITSDEGGPLRRFNDIFSPLGSVGLEALAKDNNETARSVATRSEEVYRNEFPLIQPRFSTQCEDCGAEFEEDDIEECSICGSVDLREPDPAERRKIKKLADSVNREGQSLRELGRVLEDDQSRLGVSCMVVKWEYKLAPTTLRVNGTPLQEEGDVVAKEYREIVRGDPKRIVPVVDENGRIGGVWWTCPKHRSEGIDDGPGRCIECGAELQEVYYTEQEAADSRRHEKYYFEDEVIMWSHHIPQPHGLDGLSPVHLIWIQQAILHWMNVYASEYFNPHSSNTPNKFVVVHTTNPDSFEKQLDEATEDKKEDPYTNGILYNQFGAESNTAPEVQVVDVMGDQFLGQSEEMRKRFESQIRGVFGVSDIFDSELEDAGGLNNEGLQIEVTDRSIAAAQQNLRDGPYEELLRTLGFEDWMLGFVPPRETDLEETRKAMDVLERAAKLGLPARYENGEPEIGDGEAQPPPETGGFGGPPGGGSLGGSDSGLSSDPYEDDDDRTRETPGPGPGTDAGNL